MINEQIHVCPSIRSYYDRYLGNICSNVPFLSVLYLINESELEMVLSSNISLNSDDNLSRNLAALLMIINDYFSILKIYFCFPSWSLIARSNLLQKASSSTISGWYFSWKPSWWWVGEQFELNQSLFERQLPRKLFSPGDTPGSNVVVLVHDISINTSDSPWIVSAGLNYLIFYFYFRRQLWTHVLLSERSWLR